jgi:photosystem II stability/assembly factor-like uncharacterized protein
MYKSADGGASWNMINNGLSSLIVQSLVIPPASPGTVYAGTNSSLYRSMDGGTSWSKINSGLANLNIQSLVMNPIASGILYAGTDGGIFRTSNAGVSWTAFNGGLDNLYIRSLAMDPTTPATLYAGTWGSGVYKSIDNGLSWNAVNAGLTNLLLRSFAINPAAPATLYAGTDGGVFKSTDGGASWAQAGTGISDPHINTLAIDPVTPATLYAGTDGGVFKSTDGGTSWSQTNNGITSPYVRSLNIDPVTPATLYAGTDGGVFKSTDGGATWSIFNSGLTNLHIRSLAIDPASTATLYAGTEGSGVFKMTALDISVSPAPYDFGNIIINTPSTTQTFTVSNTGASPLSVYSMSIAGTDNPMFTLAPGSCPNLTPAIPAGGSCTVTVTFTPSLVGTKNVALRIASNSANYGTLDVPLTGTGIIQLFTLTVIQDGTGSGTVDLSTGGSCAGACSQSFAAGTTVQLTPTPDIGSAFAGWTGCDSVTGNICTVTMGGAKNVKATFNVVTQETQLYLWKNIGPAGASITSPATIYAGTTGSGAFRSTDGGKNWVVVNTGLTSPFVNTVAVDPLTPATVYAGTNGGVFKSVNSGGLWSAANNGLTSLTVNSLAIDPATPATVYAGTNGGVFKTIDGGGNWLPMNSGLAGLQVRALVLDPAAPATVYAGTDGGVFKTTDGGATWGPVNNGLTTRNVASLTLDPATPATLYAGTSGGVFKSGDGGVSWSPVNSGLTSLMVNALAMDPAAPATLFAGTAGGVFKSLDGGASWNAMNNGLTTLAVNALAIDRTAPATVFAGTAGGGVFKLASANISVTPATHDFGSVATFSASASQAFTITNTGSADLVVNDVAVSGPDSAQFALTTGTCPSLAPSLVPGGSCTVQVTFNPTLVGLKAATLRINSNAPAASVKYVDITGSAFDPPPFGTVTINGGAASTSSANVNLTLFAADNSGTVAEMRFSNNNTYWNAWEPYSTAKAWALTTGEGTKTVYVQFRDGAGNASGSFFSRILLVTAPPVTTITSMPATWYASMSGTFTFTSNEASATFECRLDSGSFAPCTSPYAFSNLADGSHTFTVRATDPTGNVETTPPSYTWTIDTIAPDTTITGTPPTPTYGFPGSFSFSSNDPGATFECRQDAGVYAPCTSPFNFSGLTAGSHTFSVRAKDQAANVDPTPATYTWSVLPPNTTITAAPVTPATTPSGSFSFTSDVSGATFECRVDTAPYATCASPFDFSGLAAGNHTFSVRAKDPVGNTDPTPASYTWAIIAGNVKLAAANGATGNFATISEAMSAVPSQVDTTIMTRGMDFTEDLIFNSNGTTVTISGGYDANFAAITGATTVHGTLTIVDGTLAVENLVIM